MGTSDHIAKAEITINGTADKVWNALTDPTLIKKYMFDTTVVSDWKEGSNIIWKGEWEGRSYEDKGVILQFKPARKLQFSHFSPLSELPDKPENYHTVTIDLKENNEQTLVHLTQDNNETEEARQHSENNWKMMLQSLRDLLEKEHIDT